MGKNANQYKLGWNAYASFGISLNEIGNKSIKIELLDFSYLPSKNADSFLTKGFASIKLGYKQIFSETKTGFFVEPQLGYARLAEVNDYVGNGYDGFAAALEAGYSLEVGRRGNTMNVSLKYETDYASKEHKINSLALRFYFSFSLVRKTRE